MFFAYQIQYKKSNFVAFITCLRESKLNHDTISRYQAHREEHVLYVHSYVCDDAGESLYEPRYSERVGCGGLWYLQCSGWCGQHVHVVDCIHVGLHQSLPHLLLGQGRLRDVAASVQRVGRGADSHGRGDRLGR